MCGRTGAFLVDREGLALGRYFDVLVQDAGFYGPDDVRNLMGDFDATGYELPGQLRSAGLVLLAALSALVMWARAGR